MSVNDFETEPDINPKFLDAFNRVKLQGESVKAIADEHGVSLTAVYKWLRKAAAYFRDIEKENVESKRAEITQQLVYIYKHAITGFTESRGESVTTTYSSCEGKKSKKTVKRRLAGSPAFLNMALRSLEMTVALWKVDMDAAGDSGERFAGLTKSERIKNMLQALLRLEKRQRERGTVPDVPGGGDGDQA